MQFTKHRALALMTVLALAACSGSTGAPGKDGAAGSQGASGATGATGEQGPAGADGRSTGGVVGKLTYVVAGKEYPATGVSVTSIPNWCDAATSDADGNYHLGTGCPIGVYSVVFSGNGFSKLQVDGISVAAGKEYVLNKVLTATNPLVLTAAKIPNPAGFGTVVTLGVNVAGGTAPYTYKWVPKAANPTTVTLSKDTDAAPTFTTGKVADMIAGKKVIGFASEGRVGFMGVSAQQVTQMTYNFDVTVTDAAGFTKTLTVAVVPVTMAQGNGNVPRQAMVIANFPDNTAALAFNAPQTSKAALNDANTAYAWFIPDVDGQYTVGNGTKSIGVMAANFNSASPTCGGCHEIALLAEQKANVAAKFKDWNNSAHGNHFFKFMEYNADGTLVWKNGADGKPLPAPTANPSVFWTTPGAMTTFKFGMTGAEGTHYGASCTGCHTTGYNLATANNGADDVAVANGWAFPDLTKIFTGLTGDPSTDLVTPAPQYGAWDAIPDAVKKYAGMQCESCHGPLGMHAYTGSMAPVGEYSVAACAVCHDKPTNHDRVSLWRQSGHANLELAVEEGTSASCARCHTGQGFVQYLKQRNGEIKTIPSTVYLPGSLVKPDGTAADATFLASIGVAADTVEAITCAACHDSHKTEVRVLDDTGDLPSGFRVKGAGSGALCMVCHESRNGNRGDFAGAPPMMQNGAAISSIGAPHEAAQTDVYVGTNAFFMPQFTPSGHMAVAETCVGCHMKTAVTGLRMTNTNHTFGVNSSICKECHGEEVNGEALEGQFDAALAKALTAINAKILATLPATFDVKTGSGTTAVTTTITKTNVASVAFVNGRTAQITFTYTDKTTATINLGNVFQAGTTTPVFDTKAGLIAKANWNYSLVKQDASKSIHNPTFVFQVLNNTIAALNGAATP